MRASEDDLADLNEKVKVALRKMAYKHLAHQEAELIMQSYGMSAYQWDALHNMKKEIEDKVCELKRLSKKFEEACAPFGGIDKVEEIFKNVDEVKANFTCSEEDLDRYIFEKEKR